MKKIAIVGCGNRGQYHLENILKMSDICTPVAFCDLVISRAEDLACEAECGAVFTDYVTMYDETKPDIVFVCTPPFCHGDIELEAIRRGIHIFVEPPAALSLDVAEKIKNEAKAHGVIAAMCFDNRYSQTAFEAAKFCAENVVVQISCVDIGNVGPAFWRRDCEFSGGRVLESTIHLLDLLRFVFGEPDEVFAYSTRGFVGGITNYDTDDAVSATVRFKNGTLGTLEVGSYFDEDRLVNKEITFKSTMLNAELAPQTILSYSGHVPPNSVLEEYEDPAQICVEKFIEAVISGDCGGIMSDYEDGVKSLKFALAIRESARKGLPVKVGI